jgi:hypothetical protein
MTVFKMLLSAVQVKIIPCFLLNLKIFNLHYVFLIPENLKTLKLKNLTFVGYILLTLQVDYSIFKIKMCHTKLLG